MPFRYVSIDIGRTAGFRDVLMREHVKVLYIVPGPDIDIALITTASRVRKLLTFTGVPDYVEQGISIGIEEVYSKPRLIFNMNAIEAEGFDLSAKILRVTRLVK
jgi:hypothetical protein